MQSGEQCLEMAPFYGLSLHPEGAEKTVFRASRLEATACVRNGRAFQERASIFQPDCPTS